MNVVMGISDWVTVMDGGKENPRRPSPEEDLPRPPCHRGLPGGQAMSAGTAAAPPLLSVENLHIRYGALEALRGSACPWDKGEIVTVLGSDRFKPERADADGLRSFFERGRSS